jgi:hypothetical protein
MSPLGLGLVVIGLALIVIGFLRTRAPYARLRQLRAQDDNVARYNAWRGGVRDTSPPDGATAEVLQRQVRIGAGLGLAGVALLFAGLLVR